MEKFSYVVVALWFTMFLISTTFYTNTENSVHLFFMGVYLGGGFMLLVNLYLAIKFDKNFQMLAKHSRIAIQGWRRSLEDQDKLIQEVKKWKQEMKQKKKSKK